MISSRLWQSLAYLTELLVNQLDNLYRNNSCPRILWVGIGCNSQTEGLLIEIAIEHIFKEHKLLESAMLVASMFDGVAGFATIENKTAVIEFCVARNLPLKTFSAEDLQNVIVPHPSQIAAVEVGTPSVAEAAAILACRAKSHRKEVNTCNLIVPKQIFRTQGLSGAVTIAVAIGGGRGEIRPDS